jgi:uncharacterized membrane protein YhaH (DUF805 family)
MDFLEAVKIGFKKYATFHGRATRSEFWFWIFFSFIALWISGMVVELFIVRPSGFAYGLLTPGLFFAIPLSLLLALPFLAISTRRLHDTNLSGWWQLIVNVPAIGWIAWLVLMTRPSASLPNRFDLQTPSDLARHTEEASRVIGTP